MRWRRLHASSWISPSQRAKRRDIWRAPSVPTSREDGLVDAVSQRLRAIEPAGALGAHSIVLLSGSVVILVPEVSFGSTGGCPTVGAGDFALLRSCSLGWR